ncbi:AI-2E family transporter [Candidatus Woesearchaeota archaeon]|nr:AI-2E family transporter [Candidatus Woesearchaeota archaeon]
MNLSFIAKFSLGLLLLAGFGAFLYKFSIFTLTLLGGIILYFIIDQLLEYLTSKRLATWQSYTVIFLVMHIALVGFLLYVSLPLFTQLQALAKQFPSMLAQFQTYLGQFGEVLPAETILSELNGVFSSTIQSFFGASGALITALITIPIITTTLLLTKNELHKAFFAVIPNDYYEVTMTLSHRIISHVRDYITVRVIETAAMIALYSLGFLLIGMPHALLLGTVGGLLNIIPYLGPIITVVPLFLVALAEGNFALFGMSLAVFAVAQLIDNTVLQTWLVSKYVDIHPLAVVIVTLLGGELFGALGLIAAIPIYVISRILVVGWYDVLKAIDRHEKLLAQEKHESHA